MELVGFFAIFHGHAHGAEMPESGSGVEYAVGFVIATATLHAAGIGLGMLGKLGQSQENLLYRFASGAMALAGIAILIGVI
jgi:urease accessory protein